MTEATPIEECRELLAKWDGGEIVWTIEMGGLGPGYEQALQIAMIENLRFMVNYPFDFAEYDSLREADEDAADSMYEKYRDARDYCVHFRPGASDMGLSGAQAGAAGSLSSRMARLGPAAVLKEVEEDRRRIMISREWPKESKSAENS